MPTGINQFQLIERVLIETDDACHGTHALREREELSLQNFKKKIRARSVVLEPPGEIRRSSPARRHTLFFVGEARCIVLEPPGDIRRSSPAREIRRSSSARRDPSFFNRPVRYDVLHPGAGIRPSAAQQSI